MGEKLVKCISEEVYWYDSYIDLTTVKRTGFLRILLDNVKNSYSENESNNLETLAM